jgi:hypothetical protein
MSYQSATLVKTNTHQSGTDTRMGINSTTMKKEIANNCGICVDDYPIPPCTGFSKDYNCSPSYKP